MSLIDLDGGVRSFLGLSDTPDSYVGQNGLYLRVNATEDGLELAAAGGAGSPGGSDTQIQYNDSNSLGGISTFVWDDIDLKVVSDTTKLKFGAGADASIYYDGTNLVVNPKEVGSGVVSISGDLTVVDEVYGVGWDRSLEVPTKNAVYDKIESIVAAGGETNTASNTGSSGTGLFKQKVGVDLEFYKINSTNSLLTVALDGTDKLDFTVDSDLSNYSNVTSAFITASSIDTLTNKSGNISQWTNDSGYLTTVDISDDTNLVAGVGITLTGDTLSTDDSAIDHDGLLNFVANEHIDWTGDAGVLNIHVNNITAVPESVVTAHEAALTITESQISDLSHAVDLVSNVAQDRILGRITAGSGNSEELTATQVRALINVEDGADVTDTANVTAAGALMDSEVDADIKTLSLPANTTISAFGATLVDDVDAATARSTLGVDAAGTDNSTDVTLAGSYDYLSLSGQEITLGQIDISDDTNLAAGTGISLTGDTLSTDDGAIDHNSLLNFVANEHIDWTIDQGATNIDAANITGLTIGTEVTGASTALSDTADITYNADTDVSGNSWVLDEDDLSSDSATKVPTQQSVKAYVDAVASGLNVKNSVRVATIVAGTLATDFENGDTIDGVVLATNDRILIKDQSTGSENGIYTVNASGAPTRATDFDEDAEVTAGAFTFVAEGTTNADSGWVLTTNDPIVVGTTSLAFAQFSGAGQITAGEGLIKSGNTLNLRFSELTEDSAPTTGDWFCFYDVTAGEHKKIDQSDLLAAIGGGAIAAVQLINDESVSSVDTIKFKAQVDLTTPAALDLVDEGSGNVRLDGVGDVGYSGGVSVTDNSIVRFDNTTGYLIQGGTTAPTYDDSGNVTVGGNLSITGLTTAVGGIATALDTDLGSTTIGTKSGGGWITGKDTNDDLWVEGNGTGQVRQSTTLFSDVIAFEGALNSGLRLANIASGLEGGITNMAEGSLYYQTDTDVLRVYDGTSWSTIGPPSTLNEIGNVTITSAASGDMIRWNGSAWVNVQPVLSYITDVTATNSEVDYLAGSSVTNGHIVYADGTNFTGEDAFTFTTVGNTLQVGTTGEAGDIWAHGALQVGLMTKVQLIESSGEMQVRNNADTDYADLRCESFYSEGGTFEVKATTVNFDTDTLILNDDETGVPSADVGIEVERGTSTNAAFYWDESADSWVGGVVGAEHAFVYDADLLTEFTGVTSGDKWVFWDASVAEFRKIDNDDVLEAMGGGGRSGADAGELVYTVSGGGTESEAALTWDSTNDRMFVGIATDIGGALNVFPAVVGDDIIFGRSIASYTGNYLRFEDNAGTAVFNLDKDVQLSVNQASNTLGQVEITADSDTMDAAGHDHAVPLWAHADYAQGQFVLDGQAAGSDLAYTLQENNDVDNSGQIWLGMFKNGVYGPSGKAGIVSHKTGSGTARDIVLYADSGTVTGTPQVTVRVDSDFVGINKDVPTAALHVVGDIKEDSNFLWDSANQVLVIGDSGGGYDSEPTLEAFRNDTAVLGATNNSGVVIALSNQSTGDAFIKTAGSGGGDSGILIESSNGVGWAIGQDNSDGDKLKINNATNSLTSAVTMTIDGAKVGIGTESPTSELHVETATSSVITINSSGSGAAGRSVFQLLRGGTTGWDWSTNNDTDSTDDFAIRQLGGVNDQVEYFRIVPDGNITIGNFTYDADQSVGAGQDNYVLTYNHGTGLISLEASGGGSGDVVGPASATDNAIARFDTTTGKLIQNSVVTIDDTGNMAGVVLDDFDNTIHADGIHTRVINNSGVTINKGEPVYISGYDGTAELSEVSKADSDDASKMPCIGLMAANTTNGSTGAVTSFGEINSIDTSSWSVGDSVYVDTTAGQLTNTRPTGATVNVQKIAMVKKSHVSNGVLLIMGAYRSNDVSNKISDAIFRIHDDGDNTKLVDFQLSGLTTATTRTLTVPDASGSILLNDNTATLTNKSGNISQWTNDSGYITATDTASDSTAGIVELATIAETDAGTDATRAVTPDGLQGSKRNIRWFPFNLVEKGTDCATGTNLYGDFVSPIAGTILQSDTTPFYLYATNSIAGTTGNMVVDISINGTSIMTTNKLKFDSAEKTTTTAATPPDLTTTTLSVGDIITIDIDSVHTTAAKGLTVMMAVRES